MISATRRIYVMFILHHSCKDVAHISVSVGLDKVGAARTSLSLLGNARIDARSDLSRSTVADSIDLSGRA